MISRFSPILVVCLVTLLSGCTQIKNLAPFGGSTKAKEVALPALKEIKPSLNTKLAWQVKTASAMGENKIRPYVDSNSIYIAGGISASAHQKSTGKLIWNTPIGEQITAGVNGTLLANSQARKTVKTTASQIFLGTNSGNAIALDAKTGKIKWIERLSSEVLSVSASDMGRVVFRTVDGKLHGLDSATGELIWQRTQKAPGLTQLGAGVPLIVSNLLIAGFDNGKVAAYQLQTGVPTWEIVLASPSGNSELEEIVDVDGKMVALGNALFASSVNGSISGINMVAGKQVWSRSFSSPTGLDVSSAGVFSTDKKGNVWRLDPQSGDPIWSMSLLAGRQGSTPILLNNSVLVITDSQGYIHFLNAEKGTFVARQKGDPTAYSVAPTISGNSVYLISKSGLLSKYTL